MKHQLLKIPNNYCVVIYLCDKQYGGPEEGGWWYDTGDMIKIVRASLTEDRAYAVANRMQSLLDAILNKGRRPISSVLSTGRFCAKVVEGIPAKHYPVTTPHYE